MATQNILNTVQALRQQLAKYTSGSNALDPRAVMAIAEHEGLGGGIGDNGTSFGFSQLHLGGAYPSWAPHGTPQQDNAWAWSPQGIDYQLGQMQKVAGGMHGLQAISNISRRYERPANPTAEIVDAAHRYGIAVPNGGILPNAAVSTQGPSSGPSGQNSQLMMGLLSQMLRIRPTPTMLNPWSA